MPKVIIFDLDETLLLAHFKENATNVLSQSAKTSLSESSSGITSIKEVMDSKDKVHAQIEIKAIERKQMKQFFDDVHETMKKAEEKGESSPIAIKVITSGLYDKEHVKQLFNQFYADGNDRFFTEDFPIEYYNRDNYDSELQDEFHQYYATATGYAKPHDNPLLKRYATKSSPFSDPRKAKLINDNLERWQKEMPGLEAKDVVLVDNSNYNVYAVKEQGYDFIHYPTTPEERSQDQRFSKEKKQAFEKLNALNVEARQELKTPKRFSK